MLLLISYIVLWILLYYLEGTHDAFFTLETNEHPPAKDYVKANYYKGRWHVLDSYSYVIFHIGFALLFALLKEFIERSQDEFIEPVEMRLLSVVEIFSPNFLLLTLSFLLVGVAIRMFAHDLFFDLGMKRETFIIPTCQGSWDFWDCLLVKLNKIHPILPYVLRFLPLTISIIIYIIFFM